jgi:ribosomal protein L37AE/L43A
MHPDDLKAIWICHECKMKFAFHSDTADHQSLTGHKSIEKRMIFSVAETFTQ